MFVDENYAKNRSIVHIHRKRDSLYIDTRQVRYKGYNSLTALSTTCSSNC